MAHRLEGAEIRRNRHNHRCWYPGRAVLRPALVLKLKTMMKQLKPLKHDDVKMLVVHCVANPCNKPLNGVR